MSEIANIPINNIQTAMPAYNQPVKQQAQPSVAVTPPQGTQVYNYPQTSLYNDPNKKAATGVNIYIYNPSGIGAPNTMNNTTYGAMQNQQPQQIASTPIANTPIAEDKKETTSAPKKTKNIVKLTNDYIKTLESFLRSQDASIRKQGIQDLVKRFEEDNSRYDNASLTALLNIALQDPDAHNRMIALSTVASGGAHGDKNTVQILNNLKTSDKLYGQEAKMATNALLKASQSRETVEDNSPDKKEDKQEASEENK